MGSLKRPLAVVGFSMLLTVLCIILTGCTTLAVYAVIATGICLVLSIAVRFRYYDTLIALCIGIVIGSLFSLNAIYTHDKAVSFCGEDRVVEAVVSSNAEYSEKRDRYYVEASLKTIDAEKTGGKIRLSLPGEAEYGEFRIGDRIKFIAEVYKIGSDSDAIHNSFAADGIYLGAYSVSLIEKTEPKLRGLFYYASVVRNKIADIFGESFSDEVSGVLIALLTGEKSDCPDDVYRNFKRSGAAHIMAVSGMHLSVWLSLLGIIGKSNEKRRKLYFASGIAVVVLFAFIADFSPSVCRAALMSGLYLFGVLLGKQSEFLNSVGFALICILCVNPYSALSVSFQLSFACVVSIIAIAMPLGEAADKKLKRKIRNKHLFRIIRYIVSCIIVSLSVAVMTFPISSQHFGYVSLSSVFTNLFIIPVCAPVMVLGVLFLVFSSVPYLSELLQIFVSIFARYMIYVTDYFASLSFSTICTDMREKLLWLVAAGLLLVLFIIKRSNRKRLFRTVSLLAVVMTVFSLLSIIDKRADECRIKVINTQSGSAAVLFYNGKSVLLGSVNDYYFYDMLADVIEAENAELVAAVPVDKADVEELEYICADFSIENLLAEGECATLFANVYVYASEYGATVEVFGKRIGVFSSDYLQVDETYDIIIGNNGIITMYDGEQIFCDKQGHSLSVYISDANSLKIRREELGGI